MEQINVKKAFTLNHGGAHLHFAVGIHTAEKDVADHWLVREHSEPVSTMGDREDQPEAQGGETEKRRGRKPSVGITDVEA